ncbi:hypothetical protein BaRGS_00015160 [Batillaria attramentaria]|uniref:Uncharacterized protein n=1 Tax=Batillaria attramentaria TaxID=370345 RepID=A0ABD0L2U4_9CAEN
MSKDAFQDFTGQSVKPSVECQDGYYGTTTCKPCGRCGNNGVTTDIVLVDVLKVMAESFVTVGSEDHGKFQVQVKQMDAEQKYNFHPTTPYKVSLRMETNQKPLTPTATTPVWRTMKTRMTSDPTACYGTDHGHSANISIQGDKEAVLFHNTRTTGDKTRCARDMYGADCTQVCSPHCAAAKCDEECSSQCDGPCDIGNGDCFSCKGQFTPPLCIGCRSGFYGTQCEAQCGYGCITNTCDRQNGACSCDALWSPTNCAVKATGNSDTQDGATIVGPIVGSVLGAALLIGLFILLAALIIRRRRSREVASPPDPSERRTEVQFPTDNAMLSVDAPENKPETSDPESNYAPLENYENPDDIRPYSMLQTNRGRPTNINIQGDEEAVLYHNTDTTGDKTYM